MCLKFRWIYSICWIYHINWWGMEFFFKIKSNYPICWFVYSLTSPPALLTVSGIQDRWQSLTGNPPIGKTNLKKDSRRRLPQQCLSSKKKWWKGFLPLLCYSRKYERRSSISIDITVTNDFSMKGVSFLCSDTPVSIEREQHLHQQ